MEPEQMEQVCSTLEKQELASEEEMPETEEQEDKVQVYMVEDEDEEDEEDGEEVEEAKGLTESDAEADDGEAKWQPEEEQILELEPEEQQNPKLEKHHNFEEVEEQSPTDENQDLNEEEEQYSSREKEEEEWQNRAEEKQTLEEEKKWQNFEEEGQTLEEEEEEEEWQNREEEGQILEAEELQNRGEERQTLEAEEECQNSGEEGQTLEEEELQNRGEEGQTSEDEKQIPEFEEQWNEIQEKVEKVEPKPGQNKETEATGEQEVGQDDKQEHISKEEEVEKQQTSACAIPSSRSFAFLEEETAKAILRVSRTLIVLKGLPGSGKSHLASTIKENYEELCSVVSADDYGIKPDKYGTSEEGHKALDEAVLTCLTSGMAVVVVDDTNHTPIRLARLAELAEQHQYCAIFLEPRTEWSEDIEQLVQKSQRGLNKDQMQALKTSLEETSLPLFFGWFVCHPFQENLRSIAVNFLKTLVSLEAFRKNITDFKEDAEKDIDLKEHFHDKGMLHCTTKFCEYGKADGAKEYAENQAVKESYGCVSQLTLSALFVTPRTLGATVTLTEEQLQLWPANAEEEGVSQGSSAHITLSYAEGVDPLQTGPDLLELVRLQQQGQEGETVQDSELGLLTYFGKGMWVLGLREPFLATACFSSFYGRREQEEKEGEEKKKKKCIIQ
ncbi:2',3'-cyclic-nucleotide 3'-phosphodiesterase [Scleropages formosus]|uniref:2',3'-cyclic-nucleotide 3'-phosphodiesterase n=1 Tax=Scleropages formosus TaxID=113540 RepID=A0A8C9RN21_SCLFO|nr:2',3'-cyclic-nucleotide 3'-phosphodiesterase [Scleropages formosus]XP_029102353.1 2',3'-cyclic-nucleotide 3'-phosphodiesterase [Scleropages formosus]XP_029102354.1 2',3'-cyclic-nucleotide 3'-phosphodiesterase [Scleropages formosus]